MVMPPLDLKLDFKKSNTAGPSNAEQTGTSAMFDASNWNVNFSGTQTNTSASGQRATTSPALMDTIAGGGSSGGVWIAALGLIAAAILYKKLG